MNSAIKHIVHRGDSSGFYRNISPRKMLLNLSNSSKITQLASSQNCMSLPFCYLLNNGDMTGEELRPISESQKVCNYKGNLCNYKKF